MQEMTRPDDTHSLKYTFIVNFVLKVGKFAITEFQYDGVYSFQSNHIVDNSQIPSIQKAHIKSLMSKGRLWFQDPVQGLLCAFILWTLVTLGGGFSAPLHTVDM